MPLHPQTLPRALSRLFSVSQRNAYLQAQRASYSSTDKSAKPESEPESSESPDAKSGGRDMSSESPGAKSGGTDMIKQRDSGDAFVVHRQNFHAPIDHATSTYSPVPKRVMDGSESDDIVPAAVLSGAPIDLQARTVRIYKPSKPATQSGEHHQRHWRMDWDVLQKGHRWEHPLMGWQASADYLQGTQLFFKTKEDAIHFAQKQGYEYFVQEPNERRIVPMAYANNFLYSPKKLKSIQPR